MLECDDDDGVGDCENITTERDIPKSGKHIVYYCLRDCFSCRWIAYNWFSYMESSVSISINWDIHHNAVMFGLACVERETKKKGGGVGSGLKKKMLDMLTLWYTAVFISEFIGSTWDRRSVEKHWPTPQRHKSWTVLQKYVEWHGDISCKVIWLLKVTRRYLQ